MAVAAAVALKVTTEYVVLVRWIVWMTMGLLGAVGFAPGVVIVVELVICRFTAEVNPGGLGTVGRLGGTMDVGVGRPPKPPKPPNPKGQLIVEVAVTVLGYLVKVYGTVLVASVVSR
jgi:hypothetical protein